ncbi:MAG TPA: hypothetical protein VJ184_15525, partial [Chryseolinea sp.]|nr:hypothetical protein [Chryseolinea sp.]
MRKHYTIYHKLYWCLLCVVTLTIPRFSLAQDKVYANAQQFFQQKEKEDQYKPLLEVLNEIKAHYNVSFLYEPVTLQDKKVKVPVNYRGKVENTLSRLLEPEGLIFKRINQKTYSILSQESSKMVSPTERDAPLSNTEIDPGSTNE